ncbi:MULTISPECIES: DUF167 domain-containing protein [unclassified Thioalkalivibrio]|uniref:DUF167 domain-containing protein n=1 Tax=unclassified Thioalkalivibrio TaxID=2621013 RepID=UPI00057146CC|nr:MULTISPECIES: DUF167 domain-containing protein [unclassified Thioalkalivibrio]
MARLRVRVAPGSKRDAIGPWMGDILKLRVQAPPEKGRANEAVCALLAKTLGCPARDVTVVAGATARDKTVAIEGYGEEQIRRALS